MQRRSLRELGRFLPGAVLVLVGLILQILALLIHVERQEHGVDAVVALIQLAGVIWIGTLLVRGGLDDRFDQHHS